MASSSTVADGIDLVGKIISWAGWPMTLAFVAGAILSAIITRHIVLRTVNRNSLVALREIGIVRVMNRYVGNDIEQQLNTLDQDGTAWDQMVSQVLWRLGISADRISHFRVLGTVTRQPVNGVDPRHTRIRTIMAEKIDRLDGLLQDIKVYPWR